MKAAGQLGMLAEPVAVPADVDDVTVVHEAIDQGGRHYLIAEDLAPLFEALIAREDGGGVFVPAREQLEEEHGSRARDREVADLVDDHQAGEDERAEAMREAAARLRFFQRVQEIGERREVDAPPMLGCRDRETQREVRLPDARRSKQHHILLALDEAERVETLDLLAFDAGLKAEVEIGERLHDRQTCGAHRGLQPASIPELDVCAEELFDRIGGAHLPGITTAQNVVEGFERARHFEIRELRTKALAERLPGGFAATSQGAHSSPPAASAA